MHFKPHHPPPVKNNVDIVERVISDYICEFVFVAIQLIFNIALFFYCRSIIYPYAFSFGEVVPIPQVGVLKNIRIYLQVAKVSCIGQFKMNGIAFFAVIIPEPGAISLILLTSSGA
jgi:hypothetical protein